MDDFADRYGTAFAELGRHLTAADGTPEAEIEAAEGRLGFRPPRSLAEFYRVAGRADDFTSAFDRLLKPDEWARDGDYLVVMAAFEGTVLWAVDPSAEPLDDPPASQSPNESPFAWEPVGRRFSDFLLAMIHWQAAFGGALPFAGSAVVPAGLVEVLDRNWGFVGEVCGMRAYRKPGRAVCFLEWGEGDWTVFAGATHAAGRDAIAAELGIAWDP